MNKKKILGILGIIFIFGLTISGCDAIKVDEKIKTNDTSDIENDLNNNITEESESTDLENVEAPALTDNENSIEIIIEANDTLGYGSYDVDGNIYTIKSQGEYTISGNLEDGSIIVDAMDQEVLINFEGVNISSTTTSPVNIIAADKVEISAKKGSVNYITDNRTTSQDDLTAAIYSLADLKLKGKGELYIYGNYNNGIHTKDDLEIKNLSLYVKALNNALKGNDSVTIDNADLVIISTAGDGIKTTNSSISTKGNQKGTINIIGNTSLDVYACCDGIDAAYDVLIEKDSDGLEPTINIYTNSYSSYSLDDPTSISSSSTLYLKLSSSYYSTSYNYYAYCYDTKAKEDGEWVQMTYYTTQTSGMGFGGRNQTVYYYLKSSIDISKYNGIQIYMFLSSDTPSLTDYYATSTGQSINTTKDMLTITSISTANKKIGLDWSNYSTTSTSGGMGGMMDEGNKDKTSYSTKGIKADNEVNISAGAIIIKSYDDGIHTNSNVTLENGDTSTGNINISGGTITILSKDDGIHSDSNLNISEGNIIVTSAYEALEAKNINISGGNHNLYATDDGINSSSSIKISGGLIRILVAAGDTDAIDSNGTYTQTGGIVVSMNMSTSGTATVLDTDSTATISGGTFLAFGKLETTPKLSNIKSTTKSTSLSAGTYTLNYNGEDLITFTTKTSYSSIYLASTSGTYQIGSTTITIS